MGKKEQWQAYIDDGLLKTGMVTKAAIHGLDGTQWATSKEFQVRFISRISLAKSLSSKSFACFNR